MSNYAAAASGPAGAATLLELPSGVTRVRLRATLVDRGGGLGQTDMLLNGRNVGRNTDTRGLSRLQPGQAGGTAGGMQPGTLEYSRSIDLDPGSNTLQLRVFDGGNETFGQSAILELRRAAALAPSRPALHVLAIGVDDYAATTEAGLGSLLSAVADSRSLVEALRSRVARDYDRVNAIIVSDSDATLAGIEAAFLRLGREARAEDTVLVYLAGHGLALQDRYVFVPYTRESADLAAIGRKSLDDRRLIELWSAIPARNALLMIDTCHAGAFNMDFAGTLQNETGRLVLAAASAQQVAADRVPGTRHGPFALAIQEALRGEASRHLVADGTDQLTLGFHVRDRVPELARRAQVEQRVSFRLTSGELPSPFLLTRRLP